MNGYEATRVVFPRIQNLDPQYASKIMSLLLSQDHGEKEMIRLTSGPESLVHSVIVKARKNLDLPSNSPSPFLLPALTMSEPHNPVSPNNNLVMRKVVINLDGFLGPKPIEEIADETRMQPNPAASLDTTQPDVFPPNTTADDIEDITLKVSTFSQLKLLPHNLHSLTIEVYFSSPSLTVTNLPHENWGLHRLESLDHFEPQGGCMAMESFPEEKLLPSNIISLCISKLKSLKKLDYKGFQHLKSLEKLEIHCCGILRSLPQ